ncbi:Hsp70 family protein [Argonema antarcticum]|uniref:Hsp70 family protein n=1 Tax=Argonema antarcticum TaxID=2942763 RepID=UPI002011552A|nr:Hsp70 family protein [Argonema antarcticum]MCL1470078.1 Hsp70 family protein [Argonema antarcticum A004/B2]
MTIIPKHSPYIVGIDLGTSNSAIAVFIKGQTDVIPIDGNKTLPSVLSVRVDGEILVGKAARNRLIIDPENTVASIKREMGGNWKKEFKSLPGKIYTPTDVTAEILSKLVNGAQQTGTVDLLGTPRYAVICIPANFDDTQKTATLEAGKLANLDVLYLLEEPVAAAIAYAIEKDRDQTILVYDLGGGTFDVSILQVDSTKDRRAEFKILAKEGIPKLGGDDFDRKIMEIAAHKFQEISKIDILDLKKDFGISLKALREAQQKLRDAAETAKWELTESKTAQIAIPNLIKDESGHVHNLDIEIGRSEFNDAIRELILSSKNAVQTALDNAKLTIENISRIILVGGSTKVPLAQEMLTEMFGKPPYSDTDPDTVVARGAAIFAAMLNVQSDVDIGTTGVTPPVLAIANIVTHFLGIATQGGKFSCLIEKGREIPSNTPIAASKEFTTSRDDMTELRISVYQSDRLAEFVDTESVNCIGEFFLSGIPPKPRGEERIKVTFEIDRQNLLKVKASSSSSVGELKIKKL